MINEIEKIIKNKHDNLKGINNIDYCADTCSIDNANNNIILTNKNNQYLFDYENIGIYDLNSKIWYWSYGFTFKDIKKTLIAKNIRKELIKIIKNKSTNFNYLNFSQSELEQLLYFVKNGIYLTKESLDLLIKLCIVISDVLWILPYKSENKITFFAIKKVLNSK